ncbi:MAG: WD40 repeat domain-containing protein [Planctomycetes bacterium]|nr:WD40 repeat domain-containing protein [Planctomycetota bacterium]
MRRSLDWCRAAGVELNAVWGDPRGQHAAISVGFTSRGQVVSASSQIRVWSTEGRELRSFQARAGGLRLLSGDRLVARIPSGLGSWSLTDGRELGRWDEAEGSYRDLALSPDGSLIAWRTSRGLELRELGAATSRWTIPTQDKGLLAFGSKAQRLYVAAEKRVFIRSAKDGRDVFTLAGAVDKPISLVADPTGRWLVCKGQTATWLWDLGLPLKPARRVGPPRRVAAIAFDPDGTRLFIGVTQQDKAAQVSVEEWRLDSLERVRNWPTRYTALFSLAVSSEGLLVGCDPREVVWAMREGKALWPDPTAPFGSIPLARADASGRLMIGGQQQVTVWDTDATPVGRRWREATLKWASLSPSGATVHLSTVMPAADDLRQIQGEVVYRTFAKKERLTLHLTGDRRGFCRSRRKDQGHTLWEWIDGDLKPLAKLPGLVRRVLPLDADQALVVCLAEGETIGLWRRGEGWKHHAVALRDAHIALDWKRKRYALVSRSRPGAMHLRVIDLEGQVLAERRFPEDSDLRIPRRRGNVGSQLALTRTHCAWVTNEGRLVIAREPDLEPQIVDLPAHRVRGVALVALPDGLALGTQRGLVLRLGLD